MSPFLLTRQNSLPRLSLNHIKISLMCSHEKRLRTCLPIASLIIDHEIHLDNDQTPPHSYIYPLSGTKLGLLQEFLSDMLSKGFIQLSQLPVCAPVLFSKKKDSTL